MPEDKLFCVCQKAFIDKVGKVLVVFDPQLGLDFPGGKIEEGENDFDDSMKREVREETGLEIEVGEPFFRWYFEFPLGHRNYGKVVYLVGFKCKYLSGEVKISDEHSSYKWVNQANYESVKENSDYFKALEKYFENQ